MKFTLLRREDGEFHGECYNPDIFPSTWRMIPSTLMTGEPVTYTCSTCGVECRQERRGRITRFFVTAGVGHEV